MKEHQRISNVSRNLAPCKDCPERFLCSDKCPKDARGEYGYLAWKADLNKVKQAEKEYMKNRREDFLRSELREDYHQKYVSSKFRVNIFDGNSRRKLNGESSRKAYVVK